MQTKLKQEFHEREFANWQNRGETLHLRNQVVSKLNEERAKAQSQLLNRKYVCIDEEKNWQLCWKKRNRSFENRSWKTKRLLNHSRRR